MDGKKALGNSCLLIYVRKFSERKRSPSDDLTPPASKRQHSDVDGFISEGMDLIYTLNVIDRTKIDGTIEILKKIPPAIIIKIFKQFVDQFECFPGKETEFFAALVLAVHNAIID